MSSVSYNKNFYEKYDWSTAGEEWSAPWGETRTMWLVSIFPRIGKFLPSDRIVEIGCGYGRIAKVLHAFTAQELVLYDIVDDCVAECARIFEGSSKTRCLKTDGGSLHGVASNSVDLVFSFYSLIGADAATMQAYLRECERVLRADGVAFLHHSNAGMYNQDEHTRLDKRLRLLAAYRDVSIDADKIRDMAVENNLVCIKQECINWDMDEVLSDCFSTIVRPNSTWAQEDPQLIYNLQFHNERILATKRIHEIRTRVDQSWNIL